MSPKRAVGYFATNLRQFLFRPFNSCVLRPQRPGVVILVSDKMEEVVVRPLSSHCDSRLVLLVRMDTSLKTVITSFISMRTQP